MDFYMKNSKKTEKKKRKPQQHCNERLSSSQPVVDISYSMHNEKLMRFYTKFCTDCTFYFH